jgi:mono/diheme cytochrome c family protein
MTRARLVLNARKHSNLDMIAMPVNRRGLLRLALSTTLAVATSCGPPSDPAEAGASSPIAVAATPGDVRDGKQLYDRYCALCHGAAAIRYPQTARPARPDLPSHRDRRSPARAIVAVVGHSMSAFGTPR